MGLVCCDRIFEHTFWKQEIKYMLSPFLSSSQKWSFQWRTAMSLSFISLLLHYIIMSHDQVMMVSIDYVAYFMIYLHLKIESMCSLAFLHYGQTRNISNPNISSKMISIQLL